MASAVLLGLTVWWRTSPGAVAILLTAGCVAGLVAGGLRRAETRSDAEYRRLHDG